MTEPADPIQAAARLEQALERIATLAASRPSAAHPVPVATLGSADTQALTARLDSLISDLRTALGG